MRNSTVITAKLTTCLLATAMLSRTTCADDRKIVRGGSFHDRPVCCRSACRLSYPPWRRVYNVGFRVVCPATR